MENPAVNIGAILKEQREKIGRSLQDAAQHTCIRKTYLESLENNQFSDLPGQAYVTGFIRVYARYLGLDDSSLLSQLENTEPSVGHLSLKYTPVPMHQSRRSSKPATGGGAWGKLLFGLLAVLILGLAIYFLLPMFQTKEPAGVTSNQIATEQKPVQVQVDAAEEAGKTGSADKIEQVDKIEPSGKIEQRGVNSPPKEEPIAAAVVLETPGREPLPPVSPGGASLRMLALSESSLIIHLDDRKPHQYKLHDGLDLTWKIKEKVRLELAGPGVARFWLDGVELNLGDLESFQLQSATEE